MTGEYRAVTNENHEPDPKRRISRVDASTLIQGLEQLRECFEHRLGRLEAAARERTVQPAADRSELEQMLQQRINEIEEAQLRLRAQAERRDQEWQSALEQLEGDRALLAESWERLERERLDGVAAAPAQAAGRRPAAERTTAPPVRHRPDPADPVDDHVAHAILKQFQVLRNDVRRNARQRGSNRSGSNS
jgi:hypothetical protein